MSSFQEAKRIYSGALERDPAQRNAYVIEACEGDNALREEVEALLECRAAGEQFFRAPAIDAGAKAMARESPADLTGHTLGHYTILEKIGEGGMGVVYKARDTRLDRLVALKVLPPEKLLDSDRKRRFVQEAKAASALNHPNIVVIHDIDTAEDVTFIAMELVKGRTLDTVLCAGQMSLTAVLNCGVQIADALAAAHSSGIIHRDIKPANIMITDSGVVKVLDFGLAKLTEPGESAGSIQRRTEAGVILGTVAYMSPEQAEGKEVDSRSDIFSFGAVLYEMVTGHRAFSGETHASTLAAILRDEPKPVSQLSPDTPREVERVVERCLRKNPERRFQQMIDAKAALEEIRPIAALPTRAPAGAHRRSYAVTLTAFGCLLLATLALAAWLGILRRPTSRATALVKTFTALAGVETRPAFSPDGKQLAFAWNGEKQDNFDIYVQLVDEAIPRRVTTNPAVDTNPVWSPDALHIAFLRDTPSGTEVIVVPSAGGTEHVLHISPVRLVPELPFCGLAWSPNGRFLAYVDRDSEQSPNSIFLVDIETREKRKLTSPPAGSWDGLPSFSSDGESLAFTRGRDRPLSDIYVLPLSKNEQPKGAVRRITNDNTFIFGLDWSADSRTIVFSSTRGGLWSLWRVSANGGSEPERLPVGGNNAFWPTVSRKGGRLAYSDGTSDWNVWRLPAPGNRTVAVTTAIRISPSPQLDMFPVFSPDGRMIAWSSTHSGSHQIWIAASDGSGPTQLTHLDPPGAAKSQWSPDGRHIAFEGYSRGPRHIYVIDADGGRPHCLTPGPFDEDLDGWSRDGKWVYFDSARNEALALWKVPVEGGQPIFVAKGGWAPVESPDTSSIFYSGPETSIWKIESAGATPLRIAKNGWRPMLSPEGRFVYYSGPGPSIWRVPTGGGEPVRVLTTGPRASWVVGAAGIYVLDPDNEGGPSIEMFPFGSGRKSIVRLPGKPDSYGKDDLSAASLSPDGQWILYVRVDREESDIMMAENFR